MPNGIGCLLILNKGKNESLYNYNKHNWEIFNEIEECLEKLTVASHKLRLTPSE